MYKYEYVTIDTEKIFGAKFTQHRDVINEYAKKGYRYVGFIPTKISDPGKFLEIDLIFESEE
jgi:hypothetical protein